MISRRVKANLVWVGCVLLAACSGRVGSSNDATFDITNDTYDAVDLYVDGNFVDTLQANTNHTYDLGPGGDIHNVQLFKSGDPNFQLNSDDVPFNAGVTQWDVFDNAPVVTIQNELAAGGECVHVDLDGQPQLVDLTKGTKFTPPSDQQVCPGEGGFFLVAFGDHAVEVVGVTSGFPYVTDSAAFVDATHITYTVTPR
ncbi:MAG TPA: hypothetical protein VMK12_10610 [Anaeromyxobacteraceae bacterium]|nr:hypothetical protein [Anaeromyxobacteraceae bacterium]